MDQSKRNSEGNKRLKPSKKLNKGKNRFVGTIVGLIATGLVALPVVDEYRQNKIQDKIEDNAEIQAMRSFKNIKKDEMGKYLADGIESLYNRYPDLDDIIFESKATAGEMEFVNDIYRLYKAFMVDKSEKEIKDIQDVKVTGTYHTVITDSQDIVTEGDSVIIKTTKEQYKKITDTFVSADHANKDNDSDKVKDEGVKLAKELYELLALELGLEDNVLTSQEIQEEINTRGIYYDQKNNTVYTKEGKGHIVMDKEIAKKEQKDDEFERE